MTQTDLGRKAFPRVCNDARASLDTGRLEGRWLLVYHSGLFPAPVAHREGVGGPERLPHPNQVKPGPVCHGPWGETSQ